MFLPVTLPPSIWWRSERRFSQSLYSLTMADNNAHLILIACMLAQDTAAHFLLGKILLFPGFRLKVSQSTSHIGYVSILPVLRAERDSGQANTITTPSSVKLMGSPPPCFCCLGISSHHAPSRPVGGGHPFLWNKENVNVTIASSFLLIQDNSKLETFLRAQRSGPIYGLPSIITRSITSSRILERKKFIKWN